MPDPTLFDIENEYQYEPDTLTKAERLRKMARQADPQTSWDAAQAALPQLTKTKQKILALLRGYPDGLTSSEVAQKLDMDKGSSSKRLGDLEAEGYLTISGARLSDRGRMSAVYRKTR